jgi:putative membrane protein
MSAKLRRCALGALIVAGPAFAFCAWAQQTEQPTTTDRTPERPTATGTTRSPATQEEERMPHRSAAEHRGAMQDITPEKFASEAAAIGKAEIELSELALENSQDEQVRAYAERMVKDHKAADAKLKKIVAQEQLPVSRASDPRHEAVKRKLASLKGEAFDREYKKEMAKGHDKAVALFEAASQDAQMPSELKEFAASTLETLEEHQEQAHEMQKEGA